MVPEFELEANGGLRPFRSWIQGGGSSLRAVSWRRGRWALISLDLQLSQTKVGRFSLPLLLLLLLLLALVAELDERAVGPTALHHAANV